MASWHPPKSISSKPRNFAEECFTEVPFCRNTISPNGHCHLPECHFAEGHFAEAISEKGHFAEDMEFFNFLFFFRRQSDYLHIEIC
ncbi:unnamed protein product [Rhizophagus irregularis]|uniref:Uncharacterized protein n=1 Tax=Rhizophagus irregularis TaxID=588596 RepID=A0A915ZAN1_9GLOM|nr:unnamed protein product [Rhizophagus irregularis]CAB5368608.1 unnamed protein product [Rhizophagus irregularis]